MLSTDTITHHQYENTLINEASLQDPLENLEEVFLDIKQFRTLFDGALCLGVGTPKYFPQKGKNMKIKVEATKQRCFRCPVQSSCLDYAIEHKEKFGIWAGVNFSNRKERKQIFDERENLDKTD